MEAGRQEPRVIVHPDAADFENAEVKVGCGWIIFPV
jgi:hypothetical protein